MSAREPAAHPPHLVERLVPWPVVALAGLWGLRRLDNTDTWWHLAAGRWIAEHGRVPRTDPLSWTVPDHPWTDLQWLWELLVHALYQAGGPALLVGAAAVAYVAAVALLVCNCRRALGPVGASLLALWALLVAQERFAIRPEMATFPLLGAVLWLCATGPSAADRRLWLLPAVMLVWVNCHALFVLGVFVIACHLLAAAVSGLGLVPVAWRPALPPGGARRLAIAGGVAVAATLANPYGPAGVVFPFRLMSRISGANPVFSTIGEFKPPFSGYFVTLGVTAYQLLFGFGVVVVALAAVASALSGRGARPGPARAERRAHARRRGVRTPSSSPPPAPSRPSPPMPLAELLIFVGLAWLSLLARRNMAVFALGATPAIAHAVAVLGARLPDPAREAVARLRLAAAALLVPATLALGWLVAGNGFYRWSGEFREFGTGVLSPMFPIRAAAFARAQSLPGPLWNDLTAGGYLAWARAVPGGVWIDGRLEVYETEFFTRYIRALGDPARWQAEADRDGVQTVILFHWWPNHQPLARRLAGDPRWALLYYDETALVLVRRAGNEDLVQRALAAFEAQQPEIEAALLAPVPTWPWPIGRARALATYVNALGLVGRAHRAAPFSARLAELAP